MEPWWSRASLFTPGRIAFRSAWHPVIRCTHRSEMEMSASDQQPPVPGAPRGEGVLSESIYNHLRAIAQKKLAQERPGHTLQATALVHEAFMRLDRGGQSPAQMGPDLYWAAAEAMRRILIEHARARGALKRGGEARREDWARTIAEGADLAETAPPGDFESLDAAILRLQEHDPRAADVVRLRFFAGLRIEEVARTLGVSDRSAKRDWEYARAWLLKELAPDKQ